MRILKTLESAASLSQMLDSITDEIRAAADEVCDDAAKEVVDNVFDETQERVPVETGALRESGHVKKNSDADYSVIYDDKKAFWLNYNIRTDYPLDARNGPVTDPRVKGNQKQYTKPGTSYLYMELSIDEHGNSNKIKEAIQKQANRRLK